MAPTWIAPRSGKIPMAIAGTEVAMETTSGNGNPVNSTAFRTAASMVKVLPARPPDSVLGTPPSTVILCVPSEYSPSTRPAARMASVIRIVRFGVLARAVSFTTDGCTCTPSAMIWAKMRSSASTAPTTPGLRWCKPGMPLYRWVACRSPRSAPSITWS